VLQENEAAVGVPCWELSYR